MALQDTLKEARRRMGMSQEQAAEQLGVSRQAVTKWEAGQSAPSAKNLRAVSELYQIPIQELLDDNQVEKTDKSPRTNLMMWAIVLQTGILCGCAQQIYMLRIHHPDEGIFRKALPFSLLLLAGCSAWMAANHHYESDKEQRRKNIRLELGYCGVQTLLAWVTIHFGMGLAGWGLLLASMLVYLLYINPRFMKRKFSKAQ